MTGQTQEQWVPEWTFGDRLRKVRRARGLSQADLATALNANSASVAAWELGTNTPREVVALAKRIEMALGVPAAWMLGLDVTDMPPTPPTPPPAGHSDDLDALTRAKARRTGATRDIRDTRCYPVLVRAA